MTPIPYTVPSFFDLKLTWKKSGEMKRRKVQWEKGITVSRMATEMVSGNTYSPWLCMYSLNTGGALACNSRSNTSQWFPGLKKVADSQVKSSQTDFQVLFVVCSINGYRGSHRSWQRGQSGRQSHSCAGSLTGWDGKGHELPPGRSTLQKYGWSLSHRHPWPMTETNRNTTT